MSATYLDSSALEKLISAAVAAPSMHNTQPWRFRLDADSTTMEIHAAAERGFRTRTRTAGPCTSPRARPCSICGSR